MTSVTEIALERIDEPFNAYSVQEQHFAVASVTDTAVLVTHGLYTCKGIVIYNSEKKRGLLAHLGQTAWPDKSLSAVLEGYSDDITTANVHIVAATPRPGSMLWPSIDRIANFFLEHNPRTLALDRNAQGKPYRSLALDLANGQVNELDINIRRDDSYLSQYIS